MVTKPIPYRGHFIMRSGSNYRIKTENGAWWGETAASITTAKKWIDRELAALFLARTSVKCNGTF